MLQAGGGLDLGEKPVAAERSGELGVEDFDGDVAVVSDVVRKVDARHSALADLAIDAVPIGDSVGERLCGVGHGVLSARARSAARGGNGLANMVGGAGRS